MSCINKIVKEIVNNCSTTPVSGLETTIYLFNRTDIEQIDYDVVNTSLITGIDLASTSPATTGYKLIGTKKALNAGFERVIAEDMPDMFKHKLVFSGFEFDSASIENFDQLGDLVAIVERKDKNNVDGTFVAYGINTGLFISTDTYMANDNNGVRKIEMDTMDGQLEKHSQNNVVIGDYKATKDFLEALM